MPAIFQNFLSGTLTADPGAGGVTLTSAELTSMATVASPDYMWVTLDPAGVNGAPEIVKITTHAGAGGTAAMTRAQQSTTARAHPVGTVWRHGPTADDALVGWNRISGLDAALPAASAALEGFTYYATDTNRERLCDGTGWVIMSEPAQSYTPTFGNVTLGNGTVAGTYHRSDGYCDFTAKLTFGTTTSVTGWINASLPIAMDASALDTLFGCDMYDLSATTHYPSFAPVLTTTTVNVAAVNAAGTYTVWAATSSTVPFTFATGDTVQVSGRYRMTTRYS